MLVVDGLKLYTRKELASMLNVGVTTIMNYQNRGELRSVKIGKAIYSSEEALREFLNGRIPELRNRKKGGGEIGKQVIK